MFIDRGAILGGETYSDVVASSDLVGYDAMLLAGTTYAFALESSSEPMLVDLAGPEGMAIPPRALVGGQEITYTPTVSGLYNVGFASYYDDAASYSFVAGSIPSQPSGPSGTTPTTSGGTSVTSGTTPATSGTTPATSGATPATFTSSTVAPPAPPPPPPTFTGQDMTSGSPLTGYGSSFTDITPDSLALNTSVANAFITTGTGNDIISAQGTGSNVLDDTGGTVNFEIGSNGGANAFFLDASKSPVTWNTIANMHSGDFAIIYGIGPQNLAATAKDGLGVPGYTGLTLETYQNGGAAFITLAGHSSSELGTKMATAFGTTPTGQSYLLVAAA